MCIGLYINITQTKSKVPKSSSDIQYTNCKVSLPEHEKRRWHLPDLFGSLATYFMLT